MTKFAFVSVAAITLAGAASAQGRLIATDNARNLYEIDMDTGARTFLGQLNIRAHSLTYDASSGTMYAASSFNNSLLIIDLATSTATSVGAFGTNHAIAGLEWDSSTGTLYACSELGIFYSVNTATGAATSIGLTDQDFNLTLGYNSDTDVMYGAASGWGLHTIDRATGEVTYIGDHADTPSGLAYNPVNNLMYVIEAGERTLSTVDLDTGVYDFVGFTGEDSLLLGLVWVPSPGAVALLGMGGLVASRRRRD